MVVVVLYQPHCSYCANDERRMLKEAARLETGQSFSHIIIFYCKTFLPERNNSMGFVLTVSFVFVRYWSFVLVELLELRLKRVGFFQFSAAILRSIALSGA